MEDFNVGDAKNLISKEEEEALMEGLVGVSEKSQPYIDGEQIDVGYTRQESADDLIVVSREYLKSTERLYFDRGLFIGTVGTGALFAAGYYLSQFLK